MSVLRDQLRARHAYASVASVPAPNFDDYRIAVNAFGTQVLRLGLCAAIAWLQRAKPGGADLSSPSGGQLSRSPPRCRGPTRRTT